MKYKSRAISLTYIKHGGSSIISKIFTEEKGLQTFFIKGARSKNSKKPLTYFEPLKLISIDANFVAKKSLQTLQDVSIIECFDIKKEKIHKNFLGFFISEVAGKVLQENEKNPELFNFIWETAKTLCQCDKIDPNFALKYLLNLSSFLGFYPSLEDINKPFFNLLNGTFANNIDLEKTTLQKEESGCLKALLKNRDMEIPQNTKSKLLKSLLQYYKAHHYNLDGIRSHLVIESLRQ